MKKNCNILSFVLIIILFSSCATNPIIKKVGCSDHFEFIGDLRWDDCKDVYVLHTRISQQGDTIFQQKIQKNCKGMKTFADKSIYAVPID